MTDTGFNLVERLRRLDACALSDALDQLAQKGEQAGFVIGGVARASGTGVLAGRAVTMRVGPGSPPPGPPRHLGTRAIEAAGPDDVIVIEQSSGIEAGCWGGLLSTGAKARGIAGVIADGPVRDVDEARAMDFTIFTRQRTARTARGRVVELEQGGPIMLFGVPVRQGDCVVADESGVIVIPADQAEKVCAAAERIAARERVMAEAIGGGARISLVLGSDYEHLLEEQGNPENRKD